MTATVYASSGSTVNMRLEARATAKILKQVPIKTTVTVVEYGAEWTKIIYDNTTGYMMTKFLRTKEDDDVIVVSRKKLQEIYNMIGELLANK